MENSPGWRRIEPGWYRYNNMDGRALAYAEKRGSIWNVSVSPVPCSVANLPHRPRTLREAKVLAEQKLLADSWM